MEGLGGEEMFCFQCQEAAQNIGCTVQGVCGKHIKRPGKNISQSDRTDKFVVDSLFTTITNANFDNTFFMKQIREGLELKEDLKISGWNPAGSKTYFRKRLSGIRIRADISVNRSMSEFWKPKLGEYSPGIDITGIPVA